MNKLIHIKRLTSGIYASFDWLTSQVENHEALATASIKEMERSLAKVRVQMERVKKDGVNLNKNIGSTKKEIQAWTERAIATKDDQEKALECLKRKKRSESELEYFEKSLLEHMQLEQQLQKDLDSLEVKVTEIKRKKNIFAARQHSSDVKELSEYAPGNLLEEVDDVFERWEVRIAECSGPKVTVDSFAHQFEEKEEEEMLKAELETLISKH